MLRTNHPAIDTMVDRAEAHPLTASERLPLHYSSLDRNVELTFATDAKAGFFLALHVVMTSTSATRLDTIAQVFDGGHFDLTNATIIASAIISLSASLLAIVLAATVVFPRLSKANSEIIYFGSIADSEYSHFEMRAREMSAEEHEADILRQIYAVSRIALKKIRLLRRVAFLTVAAGLAWMSFLFATT